MFPVSLNSRQELTCAIEHSDPFSRQWRVMIISQALEREFTCENGLAMVLLIVSECNRCWRQLSSRKSLFVWYKREALISKTPRNKGKVEKC